MANWNLPTISSGYLDFVTEMNDKFVDAGTINYGSPTNLPNHAMRFNRSTNIFEEYDLTNWNAKIIGIAGGGTGSNTVSGSRANLGLGSMATQNSNAVNITGGSISGINFDAGSITAGIVALSRGGTGASLGLGGTGTVLLSNGSQVVFDTGINISQLNADHIVGGTIAASRLPGNIAYLDGSPNNWTGTNNFNNQTVLRGNTFIGGNSPTLIFYEDDQPLATNTIRIRVESNNFIIERTDNLGSNPYQLAVFTVGGGMAVGPTGQSLIYGDGTPIINLNATNITSGIVNPLRLGTGSPSAATYLRGDGVWSSIATGGDVSPIPSGLIAMFDTACPSGWTRFAALDNRFPLGSTGTGTLGGASTHNHSIGGSTDGAGSHGHSFSGSGSGSGSAVGQTGDAGSQFVTVNTPGGAQVAYSAHVHNVNIPVNVNVSLSGSTDGVGNHTHGFSGSSNTVDHTPPYCTVVYCRKN